MGCSKHPQRARKDCADCFPEDKPIEKPVKKKKISTSDVSDALNKVKEDAIKQSEEKLGKEYESKLSKVVYKPSITISSSEDIDREIRIEVSRVRNYIDNIFTQAVEKVKNELDKMKNLRWEHQHIPLSIYRIELMTAMSLDGWKFCDIIKNPKQYGYLETDDFAIVQRLIKTDNKPAPNFSKPSEVRKYLENKNGTK